MWDISVENCIAGGELGNNVETAHFLGYPKLRSIVQQNTSMYRKVFFWRRSISITKIRYKGLIFFRIKGNVILNLLTP